MSRSLGLREDQRWKDELMTRIIGYLPVEPSCRHREQAHSYRDHIPSGEMRLL